MLRKSLAVQVPEGKRLPRRSPSLQHATHRRHGGMTRASAASPPSPLSPPWVGRETSGVASPINLVVKFGGSSVATAERMMEVADIVCGFESATVPIVVLSAMGKTTNLLLQAGADALHASPRSVGSLHALREIKELHRETAERLNVDDATVDDMESLLLQLTQLLVGISIMQDLTPRAKDSLVSFGERLSTRLFSAYLRANGVPSTQYDAPEIGVVTNDNFTNADVEYDDTLSQIRATFAGLMDGSKPPEIPVVTGFLGRGKTTGAITTLGRGGSDLTCTLLGAALGLDEVQVWKDVDGVLTSDPRIVDGARPVTRLTFEEATELAFFGATVLHPLSMQPAAEYTDGAMGVRVKNSYNRSASGTLISKTRDLTEGEDLVTSIVLKRNVTLVDIVSTRMLGQIGFLARVFEIFNSEGLSVDVVATSEVSVSLTLDPAKTLWERDLIEEELESLMAAFKGVAKTSYRRGYSILSLICNVDKSSQILERVFRVLGREGVNVQMMSQGASKSNIALIIRDDEATHTLRVLHHEFFEI